MRALYCSDNGCTSQASPHTLSGVLTPGRLLVRCLEMATGSPSEAFKACISQACQGGVPRIRRARHVLDAFCAYATSKDTSGRSWLERAAEIVSEPPHPLSGLVVYERDGRQYAVRLRGSIVLAELGFAQLLKSPQDDLSDVEEEERAGSAERRRSSTSVRRLRA
jgi:hypothetical protein